MAHFGDKRWEDDREIYSESQVEAVLKSCGIVIRDDTENDFISLCPYHGNRDTPAFSTSKRYGVSTCFNPACGETVPLEKLVRDTLKVNHFEAKRLIRDKQDSSLSFKERFDALQPPFTEWPDFPEHIMQRMIETFWNDEAQLAVEYMHARGMTDDTLKHFGIGYSLVQNVVCVPFYEPKGRLVGVIRRPPSFEDKEFKNSKGLKKTWAPWNLNNARKHETCIITESTFDAMRVHQAGYPNVVALLGGSLSDEQEYLLKRYFTRLVIMTDNDKPEYHTFCKKCLKSGYDMCQGHSPGRQLGMSIAERLPMMRVSWAAYDDHEVYPHGAKDACDMTDDEIRQCLRNAVGHHDYVEWQVS